MLFIISFHISFFSNFSYIATFELSKRLKCNSTVDIMYSSTTLASKLTINSHNKRARATADFILNTSQLKHLQKNTKPAFEKVLDNQLSQSSSFIYISIIPFIRYTLLSMNFRKTPHSHVVTMHIVASVLICRSMNNI